MVGGSSRKMQSSYVSGLHFLYEHKLIHWQCQAEIMKLMMCSGVWICAKIVLP